MLANLWKLDVPSQAAVVRVAVPKVAGLFEDTLTFGRNFVVDLVVVGWLVDD